MVAYAVNRINLWITPGTPGKLSPAEAFTMRKPQYKTVCIAAFGDIVRVDSTNADFPNTMEPRSCEGIALLPVGNSQGDWYVFNISTDRIIKRYIRRNDRIPTSQTIIDILNEKARKWNQDLKFRTWRGEVNDDPELYRAVLPATSTSQEDRSDESDSAVQFQFEPTAASTTSSGQNESTLNSRSNTTSSQSTSSTVDQTTGVEQQSSSALVSTAKETYIGTTIYKVFDGHGAKPFKGTVVSYQSPYFKINYEDGDSEEMTVKEVKTHMVTPDSMRAMIVRTKLGRTFAFHVSLAKGLKKYADVGKEAILKELNSVIASGTFEAVDWSTLSSVQKGKTIRSQLFFKEKFHPSGEFDRLKARIVAGGDKQDKSVYAESQTSSPTISTEAVFMIATLAARERRHVITADIASAFLKGKFEKGAEPIIMRLDHQVADVLVTIDPTYSKYRRHDGAIYVRLKRPLYGLVEAAKLWFDELSRTLLQEGFVQNPYDQCCFNRDYNGRQQTVIIHVDDLMITYKENYSCLLETNF